MTSGQWRPLLDEKDARTLAMRFKEGAEMAGHCPEIGSDKNPIWHVAKASTSGSGTPWLPTETPGDDRIVETDIRQEADHPSASSRDGLLSHALERLFNLGRRWMGIGESILLALAFRNVPFHLFPTSKVKGDRAINLIEAQCRIM